MSATILTSTVMSSFSKIGTPTTWKAYNRITSVMSSANVDHSSVPNPLDYGTTYDKGFLYPNPLTKLPDYFSAWNDIALNLCELLESKMLKQAVDEMPLLDHTLLADEREQLCAYTMLSFTCNAYVWGEREEHIPEVLPEQLAVPLYELSESLGLQPLLTYAAFALFNWKLKDPNGPFCLDSNLDCIVNLPKKSEFHWFCAVSCHVERTFAPALKAIYDGMCGVVNNDVSAVLQALNSITDTLNNMKVALARMHERLTGDGFNQGIRPFLFGFGGERSLLREGLVYEGIDDEPITKIGQSAAQSCTIQCIDGALGVTHEPEKKAILLMLRSYMRPVHAQLIEAIERGPAIKQYVLSSKNSELTETYDSTLTALKHFRSYHVQIVAKFIVVPAAKAKTKGTTLMPWLKGLRDSTETSKINPKISDINMNSLKKATQELLGDEQPRNEQQMQAVS